MINTNNIKLLLSLDERFWKASMYKPSHLSTSPEVRRSSTIEINILGDYKIWGVVDGRLHFLNKNKGYYYEAKIIVKWDS